MTGLNRNKFLLYARASNALDMNRKMPKDTLTKDRLIRIIRELLRTNLDLGFLVKLEKNELETLVACIRVRVDELHK